MATRTITLEEQAARIERRKAELGWSGPVVVSPNPGGRRTPEKRALLEAIEEESRARGRKPRFAANV